MTAYVWLTWRLPVRSKAACFLVEETGIQYSRQQVKTPDSFMKWHFAVCPLLLIRFHSVMSSVGWNGSELNHWLWHHQTYLGAKVEVCDSCCISTLWLYSKWPSYMCMVGDVRWWKRSLVFLNKLSISPSRQVECRMTKQIHIIKVSFKDT